MDGQMASPAKSFEDGLAKEVMAEPSVIASAAQDLRNLESITKNSHDEELVVHLANGRQEAMQFLFDRYFRLIYHVGFKMLRDTGEAEDLMQDVFFEVYRKAPLFNPSKGSVKPWLLKLVYQRALDRRKYLTLRKFYASPEDVNSDVVNLNAHCSPNGWDSLVHKELERGIRKGMKSLSDKQRTVLELAYFEGHSMKQIAAMVHEPYIQVRNHYYRGLKKLRDTMRDLVHRKREEV